MSAVPSNVAQVMADYRKAKAEETAVETVVGVQGMAQYGPAYVELRTASGEAVVYKLGSTHAAERLIDLCERYLELARWPG